MVADNIFNWKAGAFISSIMVRYDIYFAAIILHDIYERAFGETMTM